MFGYLGTWQSNLRIYWRITQLLKPHLLQTIFAVMSLLLATGFALVVPSLLAYVVDVGVKTGHIDQLLLASGAIIIASSLRGFFAYEQGYLSQALSSLVAYDLRDQVYSHLQTLSFSYHDQAETGQLMSRLTVDIEAVRNFIPMGLIRAAVGIVTFAAVTIILLTMDLAIGAGDIDQRAADWTARGSGHAAFAPTLGQRAKRGRSAGNDHAGELERNARRQVIRARGLRDGEI